jgi:hypothetical protein
MKGYYNFVNKYIKLKYIILAGLIWLTLWSSIIPITQNAIAWIKVDDFTTDTLVEIRLSEMNGKGSSTLIVNGKLQSNSSVCLKYKTSGVDKSQQIKYHYSLFKILPVWYLSSIKYMLPKCIFMSPDGEIYNYIPKSYFVGRILTSFIFALPLLLFLLFYKKL